MSASGVVSIAFAKTGFALLNTILSEMLPPGNPAGQPAALDPCPALR